MRAADLKDKKVVIWGTGNEGKAVAALIRKALPVQLLTFVDEAEGPETAEGLPDGSRVVRGKQIADALNNADIVVKSPGVSLYHPLIQQVKKKGIPVTSLLNLWMGEPHTCRVICVTGTKGKSTTSSLLAHTLKALGKKAEVGGNIGIPVAELDGEKLDFAVIEVSSFQSADIEGMFEIAVLTSLFPEHLDWHGSPERYFADKLNLLKHAKTKIVNFATLEETGNCCGEVGEIIAFNQPDRIHIKDGKIYDATQLIGSLQNPHLARAHNLSNVCAVLTVIKFLELDTKAALQAMENFQGLPHRQQELGERNGVLYVNDSIATTPQAAIAALGVYGNRPVTLIAGGYDRGVDYQPLVNYILDHKTHAVICLGASGKRIFDSLTQRRSERLHLALSMKEAVEFAQKEAIKGGVILLSPAAPSFGLFRDYTERGRSFATESGFKTASN